jgi:hypothetical protein
MGVVKVEMPNPDREQRMDSELVDRDQRLAGRRADG